MFKYLYNSLLRCRQFFAIKNLDFWITLITEVLLMDVF